MSAYSSIIASRLLVRLGIYDNPQRLGWPVTEVLFKLQGIEGRSRRPDLAFVSFDRWPREKPLPPRENAWPVTPDLAVEVVSPSDFAEDAMEKVHEYFQAGVRQVWIAYPRVTSLHVYRSRTEIEVFDRQDILVVEDLFPEFSLPLTELFLS